MATRKCKDCGNQVSTRAKQCPHCGAPVKKKSGCLGVIVLLFLVFVVIGIISSSVDQKPKPKPSTPAPRAHSPSVPTTPTALTATPSASTTPTAPTATPEPTPQPPPQPAPPDWDARREELHAQFLSEFSAPRVGSTISLQLKQGNTLQGVVKSLTEDEIEIQRGSATMGFMKTQLAPKSRIRCFAADYATLKADAQVKRERSDFGAKRRAEHERWLAQQKQRAEEEARRAEARRAQERVASAQLVLYDWSWSVEHGYVTVEGQVGNISGRKLKNVEALAQFYTADKTFVTSDTGLVEYNPLMPGQVSPFKVMLPHNPMIKTASISFKIMWGDALDFVKKEEYDKARQ